MIFSSQLTADLAECTTKSEWLSVLRLALGTRFLLVGRELGVAKVSLVYDPEINTNAIQAWISNTYTNDPLEIAAGNSNDLEN